MSEYHYKCRDCGRDFDKNEIETSLQYLCPDCEKAEKNMPLKGILTIEYPYREIAAAISMEDFVRMQPGRFWQYPKLWPLNMEKHNFAAFADKITLTLNPLVSCEFDGKTVSFFDDSRNPTNSYKDRASILVALKAMELGIPEISAASTGNAGSSLAGICARLGLKAHIFVPKSIPEAKRIQIQSFGASLYLVDGDYDRAFDLCLEISRQKGWYNRNTAYNPLTIEGKKSAAFDLFISSGGKLPQNIFVPVGDGVIIAGLYKGFRELFQLGWIRQIPKLTAVVAAGSDALWRYSRSGQFEYQAAFTIADSISAGAPRNLYMAAHAVSTSGGSVVRVRDDRISEAQKILATQFGLLAEPAAAAGFAGYLETRDSTASLIMLTGSGLKDLAGLKKWNPPPVVKTSEEWEKQFKTNR